MPPWGIVGLIVWAYVHSQINPQTCTKFGANRSSRLTASQDVWMCDPLTPPPRHATWCIEGWLVFSLRSFPDESADVNQSWCQLTASPDFWMFDPLNPPQVPPCVSQGNLFGVYPFPDESAHVYQIWCQSHQPFDIFPWLLNLWPPNPPPPKVEGRIVFSLCPFPDESADVYQIWCQSVQSFDSLPIFLDLWPPKTPPKCPLVSWGSIGLAYIHSQMNLHMCAKFGSFSWICAKLVRFLTTGRAVSSKNTPKNNIYTSKIIIPARTCRHQRH